MKLATKLTRAAEEIDMIDRLADWGNIYLRNIVLIDRDVIDFLGDLYGREAVEWISGRRAVMALLFAAEVASRP